MDIALQHNWKPPLLKEESLESLNLNFQPLHTNTKIDNGLVSLRNLLQEFRNIRDPSCVSLATPLDTIVSSISKPPYNNKEVQLYFLRKLWTKFVLGQDVNYFDIGKFLGVGHGSAQDQPNARHDPFRGACPLSWRPKPPAQ